MRVYAVIGYPLEHTLSPNIHNYVFKALSVNAVYIPLRVSPGRLQHFIEFARDSLSGFNVTMPHKIAVARLIDKALGAANTLGSVNTVINKNGELLGYNTDYEAIRQALSDRGYSGEDALIVGAGGVARAVVLAIRDLGCRRLYIANRTVEKARELCALADSWGIDCSALGLEGLRLRVWLMVNATPLGTDGKYPVRPRDLGVGLVLDLAYIPNGDTGLVMLAREDSINYVDGLEILVRQALEADKIWLGDFEAPSWKEVLSKLRSGLLGAVHQQ